jgi:hypothetical protein
MPHKRPSKKLESLVKAARLYAGSMTTIISVQQKLYNRFKKLAQTIAKEKGMDSGDVMMQASSMARTLGPLFPSPGKDY